MTAAALRPAGNAREADWIAPRLGTEFGSVTKTVPGGFAAYARVLHPVRADGDTVLRWDQMARLSGRTAHRCMQFAAISQPASGRADLSGQIPNVDKPEQGNLPADLLAAVCSILSKHTATPKECSFALWEGYGWVHGSPSVAALSSRPRGRFARSRARLPVAPAFPPEVLGGERLRLPGRDYLLFEGPLSAALAMGYWPTPIWFVPQSPNLFWPHDHAWCVATEIDFDSTLVGGSDALIGELVLDRSLEAWRVQASDSLAWDGDILNT